MIDITFEITLPCRPDNASLEALRLSIIACIANGPIRNFEVSKGVRHINKPKSAEEQA